MHTEPLESLSPTPLELVYEKRYVVVAVCVFSLLVIHTYNQQWTHDFWEHSAAVRELSIHAFTPRHPILPVDVPHHSYSLYTWGIARLVAWLGISPIEALSWAALANAALVLAFFPLATAALSKRADLSFYTLLFSLLLWGPRPWRYSGFLHFNALGFVLPYPSMFATGIAFLITGVMPLLLNRLRSWRWVIATALLVFLVINTHPITGGALIVACLAIAVSRRPGRRSWMGLALALASGIVLAILWPLFPLLKLAYGGPRDLALMNRPMYEAVFTRIAPALLGLPLLLRRIRRDPLDPLGMFFGGLLLIYLAGWVTSFWALGRVMPFLVLPLFIALAEWVVNFEMTLQRRGSAGVRHNVGFRVLIAGVLLVTSVNVASGLLRAVPRGVLPASMRADARLDRPSDTFIGLARVLANGDVVIAPPGLGFMLPTFGGKSVSSRAHPFIYDSAQRHADAERFFALPAAREAAAILEKYRVTKIVVDKKLFPSTLRFRHYGDVILSNARFEVIAIRQQ